MSRIDMVGEVYGRLTVLRYAGPGAEKRKRGEVKIEKTRQVVLS